MLLRALTVWVGLVVLAILNAGLREGVWTPRIGAQAGHVLSTVLLCALIGLVTFLTLGWLRPQSLKEAMIIGACWTALTLAFEFLAGHYLFGNPWEKILADYNVFRGRVWVMVPLTTMLSPWLAHVNQLRGN
jgi:hypothetical protein